MARDSARIGPGTDPRKPRTTAYIKASGRYFHFTDAWQLGQWLADHPGFPHQDIYDQFVAAQGHRPRDNDPTVTVEETLAMVTDLAAKARAKKQEGDAA